MKPQQTTQSTITPKPIASRNRQPKDETISRKLSAEKMQKIVETKAIGSEAKKRAIRKSPRQNSEFGLVQENDLRRESD